MFVYGGGLGVCIAVGFLRTIKQMGSCKVECDGGGEWRSFWCAHSVCTCVPPKHKVSCRTECGGCGRVGRAEKLNVNVAVGVGTPVVAPVAVAVVVAVGVAIGVPVAVAVAVALAVVTLGVITVVAPVSVRV